MSKNTKLAKQAMELFAAHQRLKKQFTKKFGINWDEVNDSDLDHKENH